MAGVNDTRGTLFNIQRFSLHDGPGIRTTVFFKGCPLRCGWCHNPESQARGPELMLRANRCISCAACVAVCPNGASAIVDGRIAIDRERCRMCGACVETCYAEAREVAGREWRASEVMAEIMRDAAFFEQSGGGVTFSGGEPLSQPEFLLTLLHACRAQEIHTAVDTSGLAPWATLDAVRPYVDLFLYDVKIMEDARHRIHTGVSNKPILDNLCRLAEHGHRVQVRMPVIPYVNDDADNIGKLADFLASLPALNGLTLLAYHDIGIEKYNSLGQPYMLSEIRSPDDERMAEIAGELSRSGLRVDIGG